MYIYVFLVVFWPFSLPLCVFHSSSAYSVSVIQGFSQVCLLEWGIAFKY